MKITASKADWWRLLKNEGHVTHEAFSSSWRQNFSDAGAIFCDSFTVRPSCAYNAMSTDAQESWPRGQSSRVRLSRDLSQVGSAHLVTRSSAILLPPPTGSRSADRKEGVGRNKTVIISLVSLWDMELL